MRSMAVLSIALLCGAMLIGGAFGDSSTECANHLVKNFRHKERVFGEKMTACLREDAGEDCCDQVNELFAEGAVLSDCLCNADFVGMILNTISVAGISPDEVVDMWDSCGVPSLGSEACVGAPAEPQISAQLLIKKKLAKKLVAKALIASKLAPRPAAVVEEVEEEEEDVVAPVVPGKKAPPVVAPTKGL